MTFRMLVAPENMKEFQIRKLCKKTTVRQNLYTHGKNNFGNRMQEHL